MIITGEPKLVCDGATDADYGSCCEPDSQCGLGEGDCDYDEVCEGELVCGSNNCIGEFFSSSNDCCKYYCSLANLLMLSSSTYI